LHPPLQLIGTPDDDRKRQHDSQLPGRRGGRFEDRVQQRDEDDSTREDEFDDDGGQQQGIAEESGFAHDARSVRAATAVPTWQDTMPTQAMVVAC
jgi:hypothetical protein